MAFNYIEIFYTRIIYFVGDVTGADVHGVDDIYVVCKYYFKQ